MRSLFPVVKIKGKYNTRQLLLCKHCYSIRAQMEIALFLMSHYGQTHTIVAILGLKFFDVIVRHTYLPSGMLRDMRSSLLYFRWSLLYTHLPITNRTVTSQPLPPLHRTMKNGLKLIMMSH